MANHYVGWTFDELYARTVNNIWQDPEHQTSPRGMKIREIIAPTLTLCDPRARLLANPARDANYGFAVGEFLWYVAGRRDLESILYYNKRSAQFSDDGRTVNSAYGFRMFNGEMCGFMSPSHGDKMMSQWSVCAETLVKDPDSRRAIILINEPFDQFRANEPNGSKDVPCTLSFQFFIRNDQLILHAHMRSNDAVWGLTYDLFSFTLFQECMLNELRAAGMKDLTLGEYIHTAGSLHIYDRHFEMAAEVGRNYYTGRFQAAAPMEPVDQEGLALLVEQEEALRLGKVAQLDEAQFRGGARWMAQQLNAHRRKRDAERGQQA